MSRFIPATFLLFIAVSCARPEFTDLGDDSTPTSASIDDQVAARGFPRRDAIVHPHLSADDAVTAAVDGSTVQSPLTVPRLEWDAIPTGVVIPDNVTALTGTLERLHGTALTAFESAPNFGYQRMPSVIREAMPPRHVPLLTEKVNTFIEEDRAPFPGEPGPTQAWLWLKQMTGLCSAGFVYHPGEIKARWPKKGPYPPPPPDRLVCGYPDPAQDSFDEFADDLPDLEGDPELWSVSSLELIGLWQRETPLVFEHRQDDTGRQLVRVPTRALDSLETQLLSKLQHHVEIAATYDDGESTIRLAGAIRAASHCTTCHETEPGSLLGAFSYRIERLPPGNDCPLAVSPTDD